MNLQLASINPVNGIAIIAKRIPSDEEVKQAMQDIQEVQKQYNIAAEYVVNLDETGIFYGAAPKYIFETYGARTVKFQIMTKSLGLRSSSPLQPEGTATYFLTLSLSNAVYLRGPIRMILVACE